MIDTVCHAVRSSGRTCMFMCKPSLCGLKKHTCCCVLNSRANKGTAKHNAPWQRGTFAHQLGQTRCGFYLLVFTLFFLWRPLKFTLQLRLSSLLVLNTLSLALSFHLSFSASLSISRCGLHRRMH